MIDVHTHIDWHFQPNGLYGVREGQPRETPEQTQAAIAANLKATLEAGFTTVQNVGSGADKALRDAVAAGTLVGPRILTSLGQIQAGPRTAPTPPEQLRERVRQLKANGADLIKIFASESIRTGGAPTMSQEQLDAVCGEAKAQGLRTLVHAHAAEAIIRVVKAGCTQVEHGAYASDEALKMMKDTGTYFDPNIGLVLQNYIENKSKFLGSGSYDEAGLRVHGEIGGREGRDVQTRAQVRREDAARDRRGRRRARPERARNHREGAGRTVDDGRHHQRDLARGRVDGAREGNRHDRGGV